jgi:TolB-like protein/class 3 adenylate cyclase/Tfp pilus assembly protein PilF
MERSTVQSCLAAPAFPLNYQHPFDRLEFFASLLIHRSAASEGAPPYKNEGLVTGERVERRLAAVLAADVAGYSRLMGADEVGTLQALKGHRRELIDPSIAAFKGRIVKTTGDGMLVEFASAVDAVTCAMAVQERMLERTASAAQPIAFRIGINIGDIIIDGDDIFGDGVNIAARVENECEPGGVCLSASAFEQVRGKTEFAFHDLGERSLKNIERPVRLYSVRSAGGGVHNAVPSAALAQQSASSALPIPDKPSIAVLPFQNMSGDPEQDYFADGMVEDIITALSRFKSLFVIARNSSFAYKGKSPDVRKVGSELGVRYLLEGSVRKSSNRLRITGQLVDTTSGKHLWADRFDGTSDDVFLLQDRVTETVVSAILPRVERAEIERSKAKPPTESLDAYDFYLRGISQLNLILTASNHPPFILASARAARALLVKATEIDPEFALAYALIGQCWLLESQNAPIADDRAPMVAEVVRVARRAAMLEPDDAAVLSWAGQSLAYVAGQVEEGAALVDRAIALNPNLAIAWQFGGWMLVFRGEPQLSIERFSRAMRLNPLDPFLFLTHFGTACGHLFAGSHQEAAVWADKALQERPNVLIGLRIAAACFALAGRIEEASKAAGKLKELAPQFRISQVRAIFPLRRAEDLAKYCQALRLAGCPE